VSRERAGCARGAREHALAHRGERARIDERRGGATASPAGRALQQQVETAVGAALRTVPGALASSRRDLGGLLAVLEVQLRTRSEHLEAPPQSAVAHDESAGLCATAAVALGRDARGLVQRARDRARARLERRRAALVRMPTRQARASARSSPGPRHARYAARNVLLHEVVGPRSRPASGAREQQELPAPVRS
jgi:hypothetical protein